MGYVAARGGEEAIQNAEELYSFLNGAYGPGFVRQIERHLPYLLDRIMGEASLYAPELAALAVAQTGGDLYEAVLLLRAFRSTQPRLAYAEALRPEAMTVLRRISAAFKDIPGGQILGPTLDYSHRVLRLGQQPQPNPPQAETSSPPHLPRVADWLRGEGLMPPSPGDETEPGQIPDLTREPLTFPAPRAHRLQALARADTGGILSLGYANMRGFGGIHPTVNEVRLAYAEVRLRHPITGALFSAGRVRISEAEVISPFASNQDRPELTLGYAATLGWNETKVIAAAMLDVAMDLPEPHPAHTEAFVLEHTEPVESSGFCIHYKLPHYVTFQSELDRVRGIRQGGLKEVAE